MPIAKDASVKARWFGASAFLITEAIPLGSCRMRLRIVQIRDRGVPGKECLHLAVDVPMNLNFCLVLDTVRIGGGLISQFPKHTYWFQRQDVLPGDSVILYSGPGTNCFAKRPDGGTTFSFYWGLNHTIWSDPSSCAVLLEVNQWETSP